MVLLTTLLALASPVEPDTLRTWRDSCASLDAEACVALAEATVAGLATDMQQESFQPFMWRRDQAEYWFKQACIAGDAVSCDHVDRMTRGQRDAYCMDGVPWRCDAMAMELRLTLCEDAPPTHPVCRVPGPLIGRLPEYVLGESLLTYAGIAREEGVFDADGEVVPWTTSATAARLDGHTRMGPMGTVSLHTWAGELVVVHETPEGTTIQYGDTQWTSDRSPITVDGGAAWHSTDRGELRWHRLDGTGTWNRAGEGERGTLAGDRWFWTDGRAAMMGADGVQRQVAELAPGATMTPSPTGAHLAVDVRIDTDSSYRTDIVDIDSGEVLSFPDQAFRGWGADGQSFLLQQGRSWQVRAVDGTLRHRIRGASTLQVLDGVALMDDHLLFDLDGQHSPFRSSYAPVDNGHVTAIVQLDPNQVDLVESADGQVLLTGEDDPGSPMRTVVQPEGDLLQIHSSVAGSVMYEVRGPGVAHSIPAEVSAGQNRIQTSDIRVRGRVRQAQDVVTGLLADGSAWPVRASANGWVEMSHPDLVHVFSTNTDLWADVPVSAPSGAELTVVDCNGQPVPDLWVSARPRRGDWHRVGMTASNGVALIDARLVEDAASLQVEWVQGEQRKTQSFDLLSGTTFSTTLDCEVGVARTPRAIRQSLALTQMTYPTTESEFAPEGTHRAALIQDDVFGWAEVRVPVTNDEPFGFVRPEGVTISFVDEQGLPATGFKWSATPSEAPANAMARDRAHLPVRSTSATGTITVPTDDVLSALTLPHGRLEKDWQADAPLASQLDEEIVLAGGPLRHPVQPSGETWTLGPAHDPERRSPVLTTDELVAEHAVFVSDLLAVLIDRSLVLYTR